MNKLFASKQFCKQGLEHAFLVADDLPLNDALRIEQYIVWNPN